LLEDASRFEFFQAVALLEQMRPQSVPLGEADDRRAEPVTLEASFDFDFPASEVHSLRVLGDEQPVLCTTLFGLGGAHGPLPNVDSEIILERAARRDGAFKAFLGIFNHRLLSLLYKVRRHSRIGLGQAAPHRIPFARHILACLGLATPGLAGRMAVQDRALLQYAGLLAGGRRSAAGLEALLIRYFGIPARLEPFTGRWLYVEPVERTVLGRRGRHRTLGCDAALGGRVWDIQSAFTIALGPLTLAQFRDFLPGGTTHKHLVALTRFYAGPEQDCFFRLELAPDQAQAGVLSAQEGALLGWTAWLLRKADGGAPLSIHLRSA
jgi:type VI secretion system protein ImpH